MRKIVKIVKRWLLCAVFLIGAFFARERGDSWIYLTGIGIILVPFIQRNLKRFGKHKRYCIQGVWIFFMVLGLLIQTPVTENNIEQQENIESEPVSSNEGGENRDLPKLHIDLSKLRDNAKSKLGGFADTFEKTLDDTVKEDEESKDEAVYKNEDETVFQKAGYIRSVDGDTLVVELDGMEKKVRLIGINTPESVHPDEEKNTKEGEIASEFTKKYMEGIQEVYLQTDTSDTDMYGRLLRYVWIEEPGDMYDINEVRTKMLNGILLDKKVAEPVAYEPDTQYKEIFEQIVEDE